MTYLREPCVRLKLAKSTNEATRASKDWHCARVALLEALEQMQHRPSPGTLEVDYGVIAGVNWLPRVGIFRAGMALLN